MDWENEPWVKVYTRDTADLIAIGPEGRAIWWELIRKVDRAGVLDLPDGDLVVLADICRVPLAWMEAAMPKILGRKMLVLRNDKLIIPNTVAAQEARQSDALRQRESRARRRQRALAPQLELPGSAAPPLALAPPEEVNDEQDDSMSQNVTPPSQNRSHPSRSVTIRSDQTRTDEIRDLAQPVSEAELEAVYKLYPRKQGKMAGLRAAATKITDRADFEIFRAAVERMQIAWTGRDDIHFCPHFSTFVRQDRWRDESLPLPGTGDRWTRQPNSGHSPAPPRERFEEADEDELGDAGFGGLQ